MAAWAALYAVPPAVLLAGWITYLSASWWADSFIGPVPIIQLPLPVAAFLSAGLLCFLASIWACAGKPVAPTAGP